MSTLTPKINIVSNLNCISAKSHLHSLTPKVVDMNMNKCMSKWTQTTSQHKQNHNIDKTENVHSPVDELVQVENWGKAGFSVPEKNSKFWVHSRVKFALWEQYCHYRCPGNDGISPIFNFCSTCSIKDPPAQWSWREQGARGHWVALCPARAVRQRMCAHTPSINSV